MGGPTDQTLHMAVKRNVSSHDEMLTQTLSVCLIANILFFFGLVNRPLGTGCHTDLDAVRK